MHDLNGLPIEIQVFRGNRIGVVWPGIFRCWGLAASRRTHPVENCLICDDKCTLSTSTTWSGEIVKSDGCAGQGNFGIAARVLLVFIRIDNINEGTAGY